MTVLEILAVCGTIGTLVGKMGLWYKKTWGWGVSTAGAFAWLIWGVTIAFSKPGSGVWILFTNDILALIISAVGWFIWSRADRKASQGE